MQIPFKKSELRQQLIWGIVAISIGIIVRIITIEKSNGAEIIFLFLGITYLIQYGYKRKKAYLIIEEDYIKVFGYIKGNIIKKNAIESVRKVDKNYLIVTSSNNLIINTDRMDSEYHAILATEFEKLVHE